MPSVGSTGMPDPLTRDHLLQVAEAFLPRARVPYSGRPAAAAVLVEDGSVVPGVRVESASFPLTIPAALNAVTTAYALGYRSVAALALTGPVPATTTALAAGHGLRERAGDYWARPGTLPAVGEVASPFESEDFRHAREAVRVARRVASRAHIPESEFPVGAVVGDASGGLVPGVNVEHPDWACILCAERNALGTAVTYGLLPVAFLALSCPTDAGASPCGACRQLIAELAPGVAIWIDRGTQPAAETSPDALLPNAFTGLSLGPPDSTDP